MRFLRVLHLHNIAGVPYTLSRAQRRFGIDSDVVVFRSHPSSFGYDFNMMVDRYPRFFQPLFRLKELLSKYRDYDVYHLHSASFLPLYLDAPLLRLLSKKIVYHHHGSDVRTFKIFEGSTKIVKKGIPFFSRLGNFHYVSTPDLLEVIPGSEWLPNPINIKELKNFAKIHAAKKKSNKENEEIVVMHAPTSRRIKGTDFVINVINQLKKEGLRIRLDLVEEKSHESTLLHLLEADIVIDQLIVGWYGVLAVEAMILKKPVCVFVRKDLEKYFEGFDSPICNSTVSSLKENLRELISNNALRKKLGENGEKYAKKMHDSNTIAKKTIKLYELLLSK